VYRSVGRELLGRVTEIDYFREAISLDEQLTEARERIDELQLERDEALARLALADSEANRSTRRVRFLERRLQAHGELEYLIADDALPRDPSAWEPDSCREVAERVVTDLSDTLALPASALQDVDELSPSHRADIWARDAWHGFLALDAYVRAKRADEFDGGFLQWCQRGLYPTNRVAMSESESVANNVRARKARTLEIDPAVDRSGRVFMPCHLKPGGTATDAPRIHFHDDTDGPTGRIHIGWFGPHLPVPGR
jgi:hypothetical protein